jgi:signal transduction histidine kinase/DNA-binding NarL/FixJ family response regulator
MTAERILIVDDSPVEARITSKFLIGAGYSTTIIHDGQEAVKAARDWQPDLILLDVVMPKMDGYQVCQQLKATPDTHGIPTALYTICDQFTDYLKGVEAGANDFITKTPNGEEFLANVRKILEERRNGQHFVAESLDLKPIQSLAKMENQRELIQLLEDAFTKHVREGMKVVLGSMATSVLINRAIDHVVKRFPFLRRVDQPSTSGFLFDSQVIDQVSSMELIEAFRALNNELHRLVTKLTRTHARGAKEARVVERVFLTMAKEIRTKYDELHNNSRDLIPTEQPGPAIPNIPEAEPIARPLSPDGTLDASGILIHCNDDLLTLLKSGKSELIGQPFSNLVANESRKALNRAFNRVVEKGAAQVRLQFRTKEGANIYADGRLTALYDSQGHFIMIRCGLEMLPAPVLLQEQTEENAQLKRALHDLNEEFSFLASTISHDLRQPLHAILVLCQFLESEYVSQLDKQAQGYLQSIQQAGTRMKNLIEDVIHYARITNSSGVYEEVNLNQLVEEVREAVAPTLTERGATVRIVGELPTVTCDRERFRELFTELITNAVKFNDKPHPAVEITMVKEEPERHTFCVKDNGIGIEEPYHECIFYLFQRLHKPEEYDGTGAGLSVCQRIVASHGGRIWVRSQIGAGATFFFTLPREIPSI